MPESLPAANDLRACVTPLVRPAEWGPLTPLRDFALRLLARPASRNATSHRRCTIIKLDRLGDFILALGAVRALVEHFGKEQCRLLVSEDAAELAALEFPEVERIVLPAFAPRLREILFIRRHWRRKLGQMSSDLSVCLRHQGSAYRDLVLNWLPAGRRFVLRGPLSERPAVRIGALAPSAPYPANASDGACRELEAHRQLVNAATGRNFNTLELLPAIGAPVPAARARRRHIVIAPLAGASMRNLSPAMTRAVVDELSRQLEAEFTLIGSEAQTEELREMRASIIAEGRIAAGLPLGELIRLFTSADLVVSTESAPAHLAAALDRPLVGIIGGGHFGLLAPWRRTSRQIWIHHKLPCFGCDWMCIHSQPLCLADLTVDTICLAALKLLHASTPA